jgi:hypothetical protein
MITGMVEVEIYRIDGKEPEELVSAKLRPHEDDDGPNDDMVNIEIEGKRYAFGIDELLQGIAAIKLISEDR